MAVGWAHDGAVQDQIDATVAAEVERARKRMAQGVGRERCEDCEDPIPLARRLAVPGVSRCVRCQEAADRDERGAQLYNRRGNKDSQLR